MTFGPEFGITEQQDELVSCWDIAWRQTSKGTNKDFDPLASGRVTESRPKQKREQELSQFCVAKINGQVFQSEYLSLARHDQMVDSALSGF